MPASNATAIAAAKAHPDKFAVLGHFPISAKPEPELVAAWKQQPGMLGFRFTFTVPEQKTFWDSDQIDWFWAAAEKAETPVGLLAGGHFATVRRVAERHPGLRLLVDHLGRAGFARDDAAFADMPELLALASLPNVAVKVSGAPSYSTEAYPWRNVHVQIRRIFDAFGPERTFWGTDISRMPCTYRECVTMFTEEMTWLRGSDLEQVMGKALREWIGWKL